MGRENRKQLIINKEVQFDLLAFLVISGLSFVATQLILMVLLYSQIYEILPFVTSEELIARYALPVVVIQMISMGVSCLISAIYFNKLTNQIVGPVYRIKKTFEAALKTNEFKPIILRDNDYFKKEVDVINEFMSKKTG